MRLKQLHFFLGMLTAFLLCLASFCTGQSGRCGPYLLPWLGARLLLLSGSFQHLSPSEFWLSPGCRPDQCQWEHLLVPAQTLPTVYTALSHPENDNIHLRWVPPEKENTWKSSQQKSNSMGTTSASHFASTKCGTSWRLAKSLILFPA